jgi:hypothetical protein
MESLLSEAEVRSRQTRVSAQKGSNVWSDHWIVFKFIQKFPEAIFLVVAKESLLGYEQVSSCQTSLTTQKHLNFLSDHWIIPKFLHEFLKDVTPWSSYGIASRWTGGLVAPHQSNDSKGLELLIRLLDRLQIYTVVSGGYFPCGRNGITTGLRAGLVVPDQQNGSKTP